MDKISGQRFLKNVLVFGASGYIGTNLVPKLIEQGKAVRASARNKEVLVGRSWKEVELVEADALKPQTLDAALRDIDLAYYLVHSMAAGRQFSELERTAAYNFARAAERAEIRRIVYLGGLIPADADSEHLLSRKQTGDILRSSSIPVTEIRAGMIVGPGSAAFEVIRDLVNNLPVMVTPRWVKSKSPPIALDNLLTYLLRLPEVDVTADGIYDAAGSQTLSYKELMLEFGEMVGKKPIILSVPVLSPRLSSYWLRFVTTVPTNIARALIEGLKHDIAADDTELRRLVPQTLLGFRESITAVFEAERKNAIAVRWTEGALMFRDYNPNYAFYAKKASGATWTSASPKTVWNQVASLGGNNRYYYLNTLWTIREILDWLVGGCGLKHRRRHPSEVRVGDMIDSWRVIAVEPQRRLTLMMGMKAPGSGVLEFEISPAMDGRTHITATAYWHPAGLWGLLYWYSLAIAHLVIFKGMARAITTRAEADEEKAGAMGARSTRSAAQRTTRRLCGKKGSHLQMQSSIVNRVEHERRSKV